MNAKLYKFILDNSELPENLKAVFKAWLDSAKEAFPSKDVNTWFKEWFGESDQ